ncbi:MAG: MFS transporter [Pseudomonadales bacterium]|nr:MFS transporter [Pseudomonadales bacterium]
MSTLQATEVSPSRRQHKRLLQSLAASQKEAVASSAMTATCDNFTNAFALHLRASSLQMGFLTAFPPLLGSLMQLVSVWLGTYLTRRRLVLFTAMLQTLLMFGFALLAAWRRPNLAQILILLVILYQCSSHMIQPQWRAWMGSMVPQRQRGRFFAGRSRLTMGASLAVFIAGGGFMSIAAREGLAWMGFCLLFLVAALGRALSCYFLWRMHDPDPEPQATSSNQFFNTLRVFPQALSDRTFRNYTFYFAGMQGAVAVSAPFFAVYMLNELDFTYFEYTLNLVASIATQFLMLRYWGKVSDRHGTRFVMLVSSVAIPFLPVLWLFSPNQFYLLLVQVVSGLAWSGFNLTTANDLYDIRPHHTKFAAYAAIQSICAAIAIFIGGISGGYLAANADEISAMLPWPPGSALFLVFIASGVLRAAVLLWFVPRAEEPRIRTRPQLLQLIFRVARYNSISGVVLDWLTVTDKRQDDDSKTR